MFGASHLGSSQNAKMNQGFCEMPKDSRHFAKCLSDYTVCL